MPWKKVRDGYTRKTKSGKGGGFIGNPKQYEKLRSLGYSKGSAARMTNASHARAVHKSAFGIEHGEVR